DGSTPFHGFDPAKGQWGALQIAARWSWLDVDDASFPIYANPVASATQAQAFGGVVTWGPRRAVHLAGSFEETRFDGGAGSGATPTIIGDRTTENVGIARTQVNF